MTLLHAHDMGISTVTRGAAGTIANSRGTPADVVAYLRGALNKAAHGDEFKAALTKLGQELEYLDQPEFQAFWDLDAKRVEEAIRQIGRVDG